MAINRLSDVVGPQNGLIKIVPASVAVGSGSASVDATGTVNFSTASSISLNGTFTSAYDNYRVYFFMHASTAGDSALKMRANGVDNSDSNSYRRGDVYVNTANAVAGSSSLTTFYQIGNYATTSSSTSSKFMVEFNDPFLLRVTQIQNSVFRDGDNLALHNMGRHTVSSAFDGFTTYPINGGTLTGIIRVYGYSN